MTIDLVVAPFEQLRRVVDASPGHVGDVQQAVDAAEVDERAVVGDVLHDALEHLAFGEDVERVLLLLGVLLLEERLARQHDVATLLVHLDHAHAEFLSAQRVEVADGTHVDLRSRQERADADVHGEAALDPLDDAADDDLPLGVGLLDLVPNLHLLGFFAREDDVTFAVFGSLEQHVHDVAGLDGDFTVLVEELGNLNDAFGFVADVDDDFGRGHLENRPLDDLAFRDIPEAAIVGIEQPCVLCGIHLVIIVARERDDAAGQRIPAAGQTGGLLFFNVRHALRVLLIDFVGVGTQAPVLWQQDLNSDKHQRVRHLSSNCQGSERTRAMAKRRAARRAKPSKTSRKARKAAAKGRSANRPTAKRSAKRGSKARPKAETASARKKAPAA